MAGVTAMEGVGLVLECGSQSRHQPSVSQPATSKQHRLSDIADQLSRRFTPGYTDGIPAALLFATEAESPDRGAAFYKGERGPPARFAERTEGARHRLASRALVGGSSITYGRILAR